MTSADRNDLVPAQEKLEWVTPKISLMDAGDTLGKSNTIKTEQFFTIPGAPS
jgi:hypothetical protein